MVDYAPVLERAVAALNPNTKEARRAIYDRARRALIDGLRASDPTLSDTDLKTQTAALEAAIRRVEGEALRRDARPSFDMAPNVAPQVAPNVAPPLAAEPLGEPSSDEYEDQPPLRERRRIWPLVAAAVGVCVVVFVGAAATFMFWPGKSATPPSQRGVASRAHDADVAGNAPYVYLRQPVYYRTTHPVGTIVVDKQQNFLYVVRPSVSALRYGIGVGPDCATSGGVYQIVRKEEWPGLKATSGKQLSDDERSKNPMGARALYLSKDPRIHGTNVPTSIGRTGSVGCFRLTNDDVIHLYERVPLETRVVVLN